MDIKLEQNGNKGAAFLEVAGERKAEMTYSATGNGLVIIDHTEVDASLQGQGVGKKLLLVLVEEARNKGDKILALCPFAKSVFDKDASIRDVLR